MITRLLMAHGLTVGTYTSPHLERVNERMSRNGEPIATTSSPNRSRRSLISRCSPASARRYFETITAAAFRWFADVAVDVAVVEVGLLGRWDATNVVDAQVAVVTNIGMDHNEFAGPTLGRHRRRRRPASSSPASAVVIGETRPELLDIFSEAGRRVVLRSRRATSSRSRTQLAARWPPARPANADDDLPRCLPPAARPAPGRQRRRRADRGRGVLRQPAGDRRRRRRRSRTSRCRVASRCSATSRSSSSTAPTTQRVPTAARQVFFDDFDPAGRRILVVGTLRDPAAMLAALRADEFDVVITCTAPSPRGMSMSATSPAPRRNSAATRSSPPTPSNGRARSRSRTADADDAILVTGSLYLVGDARKALRRLAQ